jgi:hypothetical protein
MKQVPYRGPTNIGRHRKEFSRHGDQLPGICGPLVLRLSFSRGSIFIHSLNPLSAIRQVHVLFHSEFSTEYDLLLPISISSTLSFPLSPSSSCPRIISLFALPLSFLH